MLAEPYHINILFTAARITPHTTAMKFMEFILSRNQGAHMVQDKVRINLMRPYLLISERKFPCARSTRIWLP